MTHNSARRYLEAVLPDLHKINGIHSPQKTYIFSKHCDLSYRRVNINLLTVLLHYLSKLKYDYFNPVLDTRLSHVQI